MASHNFCVTADRGRFLLRNVRAKQCVSQLLAHSLRLAHSGTPQSHLFLLHFLQLVKLPLHPHLLPPHRCGNSPKSEERTSALDGVGLPHGEANGPPGWQRFRLLDAGHLGVHRNHIQSPSATERRCLDRSARAAHQFKPQPVPLHGLHVARQSQKQLES